MLADLSDWVYAVVVDSVVTLLVEMNRVFYFYAILCGLVINVVLVKWDSF